LRRADNGQLTVSVHAGLDALGESAGAALIPVGLINHAATLGFGLAGVLAISADRALKETSAAVARVNAVMFAR
jgi:hypothetical protein